MCVCVCVRERERERVLFHCLFDKEDNLFNYPVSNTVNESDVCVVPFVSLVGDFGLSQHPLYVRWLADRQLKSPEGFYVSEIYFTANKCTTLFSVSLLVFFCLMIRFNANKIDTH